MSNYTLKLKCNNCMNIFTQAVPVGTPVEVDPAGALIYEQGGEKILAMCPKCGTFHGIQRI